METERLEYVGFWSRVGASLIDSLIMVVITLSILTAFYGFGYWVDYLDEERSIKGPMDFLISYVFPAATVIIFWVLKQATPGKMAISAKLVDAKTGNSPSIGQCIGRYFAYYLSIIPLCLGIFWIGFDSRKQGWHDKLAGTVVVRNKNRAPRPVSFD